MSKENAIILMIVVGLVGLLLGSRVQRYQSSPSDPSTFNEIKHDDFRKVTCWIHDRGISCLTDKSIIDGGGTLYDNRGGGMLGGVK